MTAIVPHHLPVLILHGTCSELGGRGWHFNSPFQSQQLNDPQDASPIQQQQQSQLPKQRHARQRQLK
jgi:hypothetical protein